MQLPDPVQKLRSAARSDSGVSTSRFVCNITTLQMRMNNEVRLVSRHCRALAQKLGKVKKIQA